MTKFTDEHKATIRSCYRSATPLEMAEALDLPFRIVAQYCDTFGLYPCQFEVAKNVRKATLADAYYPPEEA